MAAPIWLNTLHMKCETNPHYAFTAEKHQMPENNNSKAVTKVLDAARRKLLETGTRNRLIHVNRANQRSNSLNIINESADEIYAILRAQSKRMRFKAMGTDKTDEDDDMHLAVAVSDAAADQTRLTDNIIETPLGPDALARRLLRLAGDARTAEEEQGLNILYLAIGFLKWKESAGADIQREAPLILLPVQLVRNERTSTFDILCREDDITTNLPLQSRLRQDFGIMLPEVEETEEWTPSQYYALVKEAISGQPGWSVEADAIQLGFFSFAKLLMHRDLDPETWPDDALSGNPLLKGLLAEGFDPGEALFNATDRLDDKLDPAEMIQVIDADASQTKVIEEVRNGSSLVVQGPPGTGKSQTITNIIAAAVHDGKTVLFVAEKMAALSVVHSRLVKCGLRDVCLELHSRTANKKALSQELGRTLMASATALPAVGDPSQLRKTRDELNRISSLLHEPVSPGGDSPFSTLSEIIGFLGNGASHPAIPAEGLEKLDGSQRQSAINSIKAFLSAMERVGNPAEHAFSGAQALDLQPTDLSRLESEVRAAIAAINMLKGQADDISESLQQPAPRSFSEVLSLISMLELLDNAPDGIRNCIDVLFPQSQQPRLLESLDAGVAWTEAHAAASTKFASPAWSASLVHIRSALVKGRMSFFSRLFGKYRNASKELASILVVALPKSPTERLALVDQLDDVQAKRKALADDEGWLQSVLGSEWRGERTAFADLSKSAYWLSDLQKMASFTTASQVINSLDATSDPSALSRLLSDQLEKCKASAVVPVIRLKLKMSAAGLGENLESASLTALTSRFEQMLQDTSRYADWADFSRSIGNAAEQGAAAVIASVQNGSLRQEDAVQEFAYACAEARWNFARQKRPELNALMQMNRHELVRIFAVLEKERIATTKTLILSRHFDQMPRGSTGEMGIIRGEIARKRGHKPLRWVMKNAGAMVQRIKPVMLMSPISVAQFLPPLSVTFDLLVIDEASQIKPEDALGVVARARQIVVVGDQKQLPPTSFFDRLVDDAEDNDEDEDMPAGATAADMESILSLCEARGLRQRMLEWHYRSRDPSLIRVSNAEFYNNSLVLPPSPLQLDGDYGLKFQRVPGVYVRGKSGSGRQGTNRIEAEAVVRAIAEHAQRWPDLSLGVVAFSKAQADMLADVLELERRRDPVLDEFLREGKSEDVFVKNIENVQGDERDVILISVGYGPQEAGGPLTAMNFGPVNGEGGGRRLNVLFSRARIRCEVFTSFDPGDIDPSKSSRDGPRILKRFLEYARSGVADERTATGLGAASPFEEDVARVIQSLGYLTDLQVGTAGFRIDIGVRHPDRPGQYLVAVECDGMAYHSAPWARERDRSRQGVLENLGWKFHRIWSTDWFHHRKREVDKLAEALEHARTILADGIKVTGANYDRKPAEPVVPENTAQPVELGHLKLTAPAYVRADIVANSRAEPHEEPLYVLMELVEKIVAVEGPVHLDEIPRRIASAYGRARAGKRIIDVTNDAIRAAIKRDPSLKLDGQFFVTQNQMENPPVRDRSAESGGILKPECLPPSEIVAAAQLIRQESGDTTPEELTKSVARLLGFQRVGPELSAVITRALL